MVKPAALQPIRCPAWEVALNAAGPRGSIPKYFESHRFESLLLTKNQQMIKIVPEVLRIDREGICVKLPDLAEEVSDRSVRRHRCEDITVQLIQNRSVFSGRLLDFNACSFKISLTIEPPQSFELIEPLKPATIIFTSRAADPVFRRVPHCQIDPGSSTAPLHYLRLCGKRFNDTAKPSIAVRGIT